MLDRKSCLPVESITILTNITEHAKDNCNIKSIFRTTWRAIFELQSLPRIPKLNKWIIILGCENKKYAKRHTWFACHFKYTTTKNQPFQHLDILGENELVCHTLAFRNHNIHFNAYTRTYMSHYWDANFAAYLVAPCWYA